MDMDETVELLANAINNGHFSSVRRLLDNIVQPDFIQKIEQHFAETKVYDPLILAIRCKEEDIALYLVEKGFNHRLVYTYPDSQCDEWCYYEHLEDKCPLEFDALDLSQEKGLEKVTIAIQEIRLGRRMPGDGLALMQHPGFKREDSSLSNRKLRSPSCTNASMYNTKAMTARRWVREAGTHFLTRTGDTLMHLSDTAAKVHVCANLGLNVNATNFNGDTALHIAVRDGQKDVCQALLMNGADATHRNKLGQTPADMCPYSLKSTFDKFRIGLLQTVIKGEYNTLQRLVRLWCNPHSNITRDGRSALQLAALKKTESENHLKLYNILQINSKTLELIHAVLSEDEENLQRIMTEKGWTLNKRFQDKFGDNVLSCAVQQHNLKILQLLVEQQQMDCPINCRVKDDDEDSTHTVPILFKTLDRDCPDEIWSYLDFKVDCFQVSEKDHLGNTALLRAIAKGKSNKFIKRFIKRHLFQCLTDRNVRGQTARDLAQEMNRQDIVDTIDHFISHQSGTLFLLHFPVSFYGYDKMESLGNLTKEHYIAVESIGVALHNAATNGEVQKVTQFNDANYKDVNGYTALTRAVVHGQFKVAEELITERPMLKVIGDNCNRYPLHYAYALPAEQGHAFVKLLLQKNPEDIEFKVDKDGRTPADYKELRDTDEIRQMLIDVRTLDTFGQLDSIEITISQCSSEQYQGN